MCLSRGFVVSSFCCAVALSAPGASVGGAPIVDVSLVAEAPSELLTAIAGNDAAQVSFEKTAAASDVRAFNAALQAAGPRIDAIARQVVQSVAVAGKALSAESSSFLGRRGSGGAQVINVDVAAGDMVDTLAVIDGVRGLDEKRVAEESQEFTARVADFNVLTDFVVRGAGAAASSLLTGGRRAGASFVEFQAPAGPTTAAVANMVARHAASEELSRGKHLALAFALLRRENEMLRAALRREAAASHASAASFVSAGAAEVVAAEPGQYVFNLVPPGEEEQDTLAAIDAVLVDERRKQAVANELVAGEKQRALEAEEVELRRAVR